MIGMSIAASDPGKTPYGKQHAHLLRIAEMAQRLYRDERGGQGPAKDDCTR